MSDVNQEGGLKRTLGAFQLWVIGVGVVISGNFFGWNFGIASAGYTGFVVAIALTAIMYLCMVLGICELATVMPYAGGPYAFARRTMGRLPAFITGIGVVLEYMIAAPVIALGIGGYVNFLFPVNPVLVALVLYIVFCGVHIMGIGEMAKLETVLTIAALLLLVMLWVVGFPNISTANLFGADHSTFFPNGFAGVWGACPYAMWLFLAVEMVPMLAEETVDPEKNLPKGNIAAMITLLILCFLTSTVCTGLAGMDIIGVSGDPLSEALTVHFGENFWLAKLIATVGLAGLLASFSGVMIGYSRQVFALARLGYLPAFMGKLHPTRRTPVWAIILPGVVGLVLVTFINPDELILLSTFGALITYVVMNVAVIILRKTEPNLHRPYRVPLFPVLTLISIALACVWLFASIFREPIWFVVNLIIFGAAIIYYFTYARHHINLDAPEEAMFNDIDAHQDELAMSSEEE
ncbi:MAG: ethanolamine permease [Syntrophomonadaceae bacterium]|nr:ethanolamine permease [Syntrophomonadaceae bacterium]MDD3889806.1 ethanolamine permease [Syntrophomonadaceae bacterium]MDD4549559.1 ethanolamine permease [Syntrophomonadaceae bacterium]